MFGALLITLAFAPPGEPGEPGETVDPVEPAPVPVHEEDHDHDFEDADDDGEPGYTRRVEVQTEIRIPTMAASATLDEDEIERNRGEGLADALTGVAGVTTLRSGTRMAKPIIRGQVGRRNLILFDGVRHQGQKWGVDHAPEVDPQAAGRITVVKGASTTRFGPDAIGGVVIIDPPAMRFRPGMTAQVGTVGYSNPLGGGGFARIDMAHRELKGFAWRVDGNMSRHRAALAPDYPIDNTGSFEWNAGARLAYRRKPFEFSLSYRRMQVRSGIFTGQRVSTPDEFDAAASLGEPVSVDLYSSEFRIERPKQEFSHLTYAYQLDVRDEFEIVRGSVPGSQLSFDLATHTGDVHFDQHLLQLTPRLTLVGVAGADVNGQVNDFESADTLIPDYEQSSWGGYVVQRLVHPRVEVEVGGRYDGLHRVARLRDRDYLGQLGGGRLDEEACTQSAEDQGGGTCRKTFHTGSASVGALVRPSVRAPELSMRADLSSSARIPQIDEQFMNGSAPSFPVLGLGSSKIGIERSWGGTLTFVYDADLLYAEASGFGSYVDDYVYCAGAPQEGESAPLTCTIRGPFPVYEFEAVDAVFGGGEVVLKHRLAKLPFEVGGDGAWVRAYDVRNDRPLSFIPADRYRLSGRYLWPDTRVSQEGSVGLEATFVDRVRQFDGAVDFADPPPGYVLLGGSAEVEFPVAPHVFRLGLRGGNLTNTRYREYTSLLRYFADEPGWMVQLRFSVEFDVDRGRGWRAERQRRRELREP